MINTHNAILDERGAAHIHRSPYCKLSLVIVKERCREGVGIDVVVVPDVQENSKKNVSKSEKKKEALKNVLRTYQCRAAAASSVDHRCLRCE